MSSLYLCILSVFCCWFSKTIWSINLIQIYLVQGHLDCLTVTCVCELTSMTQASVQPTSATPFTTPQGPVFSLCRLPFTPTHCGRLLSAPPLQLLDTRNPLNATWLPPGHQQGSNCGARHTPFYCPLPYIPQTTSTQVYMDVSRLLKGWRSYREFRGRMWTFTYRVTTICMIQGKSPRRIWALRQGPLGMKPQFLVLELVFQMLPSPRPLLCVVSLLMRSPLPVVLFFMSL